MSWTLERKGGGGLHFLRQNEGAPHVISCNKPAFFTVFWGSSPTGLRQYCMKLHHTVISTQPNQLHKVSGNREKEKWGVKCGWKEDRPKHTGTSWVIRVLGFMMVTSWWRRSGWEMKSSGASFFITVSSCSAAYPGTPYQVFGSPLKQQKQTNLKKHRIFQQLLTKSTSKYQCKQNGSPVSTLRSCFLRQCSHWRNITKYHQKYDLNTVMHFASSSIKSKHGNSTWGPTPPFPPILPDPSENIGIEHSWEYKVSWEPEGRWWPQLPTATSKRAAFQVFPSLVCAVGGVKPNSREAISTSKGLLFFKAQ